MRLAGMERASKSVLILSVIALCLPAASAKVADQAAGSIPCAPQAEIDRALGKASSLLQQEQYRDAAEVLATYSHAKCDARTYLLLAAALDGVGDSANAEAALRRAHLFWPANTGIAASLAREYMNAQQIDKAVEALADFHATATTPLQEMQVGVVVYLAGHRLVPALAIAEAAYKFDPSLDTLLLLANVLQLQGRYKDVNRLLQDRRTAYATSPNFLLTLAESENDASLWEAARDDLEHAIALDNKSYRAHYLLGNVLAALNETDKAESEYRTAIALAPDQPRTYYQLALLLHAKQDDAGEVVLLTKALAADEHYAPAHCEMGRILIGQHQLAGAVTELNLAIQDNPRIEQAYVLLARAYAGLGQKEEADAMVKRYTQLRAANRRTSVDQRPDQLGVDQTARE